jgi:hypothetical protein
VTAPADIGAVIADGVTAGISYALDTGEKLVNETFGPGNIHRRSSGSYEMQPMRIRDGRALSAADAAAFSLDTSGFVLAPHPTAMTDFFDAAALKAVYYPEVIALIKALSGARRVEVFDHTLRSGDESEREARLLREPVLAAHNDYTDWSGPQRLRELIPDEAEVLLQRRFAIIQVWRAIDRPIVANPLALADARSVAPTDLVISERRYPHRIGQTYRLRHNPAHDWVYFPRMQRNEALVFKVYDSDTSGRARFTPHTSFIDPATPADAPPRQSIEVRTLAFF